MHNRIGVIVPVYKVEKYIAECIESILAQTYTNFRLILVDDGSPDNAGKICDEYSKKDPRITVIHQENAGVTRARARGVEEAEDCEFITFVDGDDMLAPTALEKYQSLMTEDIDIVLNTTYYTEHEKTKEISPFYHFEGKRQNIRVFRSKMISTKGGMPWGRLFRKNIITTNAFDIPRDVYYGEDAIMNCRIAFNTEKDFAIIDKPLYFYRQENDGVCKNFSFNPTYEELLRVHLLKSIPKEELNNYYNDYIWRRFWIWKSFFNNSIKRPSYYNTAFHKTLTEEIQKIKHSTDRSDWILLKYGHPIIRFTVIAMRKIKNLFNRAKQCKKDSSV